MAGVMMKGMGNLKFFSWALKLPVAWTPPKPGEEAGQYSRALPPATAPQVVPPWFLPAEQANGLHQDACDRIGLDMKELHDTMIDAVEYAHRLWTLKAGFRNLTVAGATASGGPGCLSGPELEPLIKSYPGCAGWTGNMAAHRDTIAKAVSKCFKSWQDMVTVPGLPWYPLFMAVPSPMAPPSPNVPMPLLTCQSAALGDITQPERFAREMCAGLDNKLKQQDLAGHHKVLYDAIAAVLAPYFLIWVAAQPVKLVFGKGPVPSFAPPFVPVGPVMAGDIIPVPGHLIG